MHTCRGAKRAFSRACTKSRIVPARPDPTGHFGHPASPTKKGRFRHARFGCSRWLWVPPAGGAGWLWVPPGASGWLRVAQGGSGWLLSGSGCLRVPPGASGWLLVTREWLQVARGGSWFWVALEWLQVPAGGSRGSGWLRVAPGGAGWLRVALGGSGWFQVAPGGSWVALEWWLLRGGS